MSTTELDAVVASTVLHALAVKGFADDAVLARRTGWDAAAVGSALRQAEARRLVVHREGRITGWMLTSAGRDAHAAALARESAALGCGDLLEGVYEGFLHLNEPMKQLCTDWQLNGQPAECVTRLVELDGAVQAVLAPVALPIPRYGSYADAFADALRRLRSGDTDAFTKPLSESYHDVWMELHQDLLLSLGRSRSAQDGH